MSVELTKPQQEVLDYIQKNLSTDWFRPEELPPYVHQREAICRRLRKKGYLDHGYNAIRLTRQLVFRLKGDTSSE